MAIEIKDRVAVGDNKYTMRTLSDGRVELTPSPDSVQEPGTPLNKALLQPIVDSVHNVTMNTSDYVVEQGTSGSWTYRKWNSGIAECWCKIILRADKDYAQGQIAIFTENYPIAFYVPPLIFVQFMNQASDIEHLRISKFTLSDFDISMQVREGMTFAKDTVVTISCHMVGKSE